MRGTPWIFNPVQARSSHLILTLAEVVLDVNLSDISGDIWD